jgi:hypothetical protein
MGSGEVVPQDPRPDERLDMEVDDLAASIQVER